MELAVLILIRWVEIIASSGPKEAWILSEHFITVGLDPICIFDSHAPWAGIQTTVAYCKDHISRQRRWSFLAMKKSVPWWERCFLEIDAHTVDWRTEDVISVPRMLKNTVEVGFQIYHVHTSLEHSNRALLGVQIQVIGCLLLWGRFAHT